jgi:hypothetical protein
VQGALLKDSGRTTEAVASDCSIQQRSTATTATVNHLQCTRGADQPARQTSTTALPVVRIEGACQEVTINVVHMDPERHTVYHFSQANPFGPGCDSAPALLRRVADSIEALGPMEIQDIVIHSEITEHGDQLAATVYYHLPKD